MISILHEHVLRLILQHLPLKQKFLFRCVCRAFRFVLNQLLNEQKVLSVDQQLFGQSSSCGHTPNELIVFNTCDLGAKPEIANLDQLLSHLSSIRHLVLGETKTLPAIQVARAVVRHCKRISCVHFRDLGSESEAFQLLIHAYADQLKSVQVVHLHDQRLLKRLLIDCRRLLFFETVGRYALAGDLLSLAGPDLEKVFARPGWLFGPQVRPQDVGEWPVAQSIRSLGHVWASQLLLIVEFHHLQELQVVCGQHVHLLFLIAGLAELRNLNLIGCPSSTIPTSTDSPTLTELNELVSRLVAQSEDNDKQQHGKLLQQLDKLFTVLEVRDWMLNPFDTCLKWILLHCKKLKSLKLAGQWLGFESLLNVSHCCPQLERLVMRLQPMDLNARSIQEKDEEEETVEEANDLTETSSFLCNLTKERLQTTLNAFEHAFQSHPNVNTLVLDCCDHRVQKSTCAHLSLQLDNTAVIVLVKALNFKY